MATEKKFHSILAEDGHLLSLWEAFEASWHVFFTYDCLDGLSKNPTYRSGCHYGSAGAVVSVVTRLVFFGDVFAWWGLLDQAEVYYRAARTLCRTSITSDGRLSRASMR